jgi:hypothetical protein
MAIILSRLSLSLYALALIACGGDARRDVMAERVFLPAVPRDELPGVWQHPQGEPSLLHVLASPKRSWGPELLTLVADGTCTVSRPLVDTWVACEALADAKASSTDGCSWAVRPARESESVVITFQLPDRRWQETRFGAFRHAVRKDVALLSTCGLGDAYGLSRQQSAAAEQ